MIAAWAESALPNASVLPRRSSGAGGAGPPDEDVKNSTSVSRIARTRHAPWVAWSVRTYARFVFHAMSIFPREERVHLRLVVQEQDDVHPDRSAPEVLADPLPDGHDLRIVGDRAEHHSWVMAHPS